MPPPTGRSAWPTSPASGCRPSTSSGLPPGPAAPRWACGSIRPFRGSVLRAAARERRLPGDAPGARRRGPSRLRHRVRRRRGGFRAGLAVRHARGRRGARRPAPERVRRRCRPPAPRRALCRTLRSRGRVRDGSRPRMHGLAPGRQPARRRPGGRGRRPAERRRPRRRAPPRPDRRVARGRARRAASPHPPRAALRRAGAGAGLDGGDHPGSQGGAPAPGRGALPLQALVAALPPTTALSIEVPVTGTTTPEDHVRTNLAAARRVLAG